MTDSPTSPGQQVRELAEKYLDEEGVAAVVQYLIDGERKKAKMYVFGAIDRLFAENKIDGAEASGAYQKLGITPKSMFKIRTKAKTSD